MKDSSEFTQATINIVSKRAGQQCSNPSCRRPTSGGHTVKDKYTVIGEAAHIYGQTSTSKRYDPNMTPQERGDIENAIWLCSVCHKLVDTDELKYPARLLIKWKTDHERTVLDENKEEVVKVLHKPVLDLLPIIGYTGGTKGHFHTFTVKNLSSDEVALSCKFIMKGFGFVWRPDLVTEITLEPKDTKDLIYEIPVFAPPSTPPIIRDLFFVMEYQNSDGQWFISKRAIEQVPVRSGIYNELRVGKYFPPHTQTSAHAELIGMSPYMGGSRVGIFEIRDGDEIKKVKIGISDTLLATWDFITSQDVEAAINELGRRKIEQMLEENSLSDYQFTSFDFSNDYQNGYEGFKKLCDSLKRL